jgi:Tfp pilus assembly protein PilX
MVEMLMALVLVAFVALTAMFVYTVNERAFRAGRDKLMLQQNASWCLENLNRDIRGAWRVDLVGGDRLVLYDVSGSITTTWEAGTVDGVVRLKRNSLAMAPEECTVLLFDANADTSAVGVELEFMDEAENRVRLAGRAALRNFEVEGT